MSGLLWENKWPSFGQLNLKGAILGNISKKRRRQDLFEAIHDA